MNPKEKDTEKKEGIKSSIYALIKYSISGIHKEFKVIQAEQKAADTQLLMGLP